MPYTTRKELYTTMSWRETKIIQAAQRVLEKNHYFLAAGEMRAVLTSQSLPYHRQIRGDGDKFRGRPVKTVDLPAFPKIKRREGQLMLLPAPAEMRAIDASRL